MIMQEWTIHQWRDYFIKCSHGEASVYHFSNVMWQYLYLEITKLIVELSSAHSKNDKYAVEVQQMTDALMNKERLQAATQLELVQLRERVAKLETKYHGSQQLNETAIGLLELDRKIVGLQSEHHAVFQEAVEALLDRMEVAEEPGYQGSNCADFVKRVRNLLNFGRRV